MRNTGLLFLALAAAACGKGTGGVGQVSLYLKGAPPSDAAQVNVAVQEVTLVTSEGTVSLVDSAKTVDLVAVQKDAGNLLGGATVDGTISQIRLLLGGTVHIVYADGTEADATVPSGTHTGIKIVGRIEPSAGGSITLDLGRSIVQAGKKLLFLPVIHVALASSPGAPEDTGDHGSEATVATPAVPADPPDDPAIPAEPAVPGDDGGTDCRAEAGAEAAAGLGDAAGAGAQSSLDVTCAVR